MRRDYYILRGKEVFPVEDSLTWARMFEKFEGRIIGKHYGEPGEGDVSTVFLGLDHGYGDEPPQIFETFVFGGPLDQEMVRYSTYEEAERGHAAMVERVKGYAKSLRDNAP